MRATVVCPFFFGDSSLFVERCRLILWKEVVEIEVVCITQAGFVVVFDVCRLLDHAKQTGLSGSPLEVGQG